MPQRLTTPQLEPKGMADPVKSFNLSCNDTFTEVFFGTPFPSKAAAAAAWPRYRREVWARARRSAVPRAAEVFDGLSFDSEKVLRTVWNHSCAFDAASVLRALQTDRENLETFTRRDRKGAKAIGDFLEVLRADFDLVERLTRDLADFEGPHWQRVYPGHALPWGPYGRVAPTIDDFA